MSQNEIISLAALLFSSSITASSLVACKSSEATTTAPTTSSAPTPVAPQANAPVLATKPAAAPHDVADFDLSSADPSWKDWVAQGAKDAKVMQDGYKGARLAANGPNILEQTPGGDQGFDVSFEWGKGDLKSLKKNILLGDKNSNGQVKNVFTKEEPGAIEWTTEVGTSKAYNFEMHMKVAGKDVTCKNNYMIGAGNEAQRARFIETCKSLHKKS